MKTTILVGGAGHDSFRGSQVYDVVRIGDRTAVYTRLLWAIGFATYGKLVQAVFNTYVWGDVGRMN